MATIYLDNNATTKPCEEAVSAMLPFLTDQYGNPSSVHRFGQRSRQAIDEARGHVAALVGAAESELIFTGGGTESINACVRGMLGWRSPRKRIVTTTVEHSAMRELAHGLAREGYEVIEIGVDPAGHLDIDAFTAALDDTAALASAMWANNETGVLFPVEQLAALCREKGVPFHCDATQAVGKIPTDFRAMGLDAASFASHKFHGPKGVGAMYVRKGLRLRPALIIGGPQERGRRGGTENVPGIVGMGAAAQAAQAALPEMSGVLALRDRLETSILSTIESTSVNGDPAARLPNTTNIAFAQLEAEAILLLLSEQDVCASAGAACASGSLEPSHVLRAMNIDPKIAHGAIRFSLSRLTTEAEVTRTLEILPPLIARLRRVLPVAIPL